MTFAASKIPIRNGAFARFLEAGRCMNGSITDFSKIFAVVATMLLAADGFCQERPLARVSFLVAPEQMAAFEQVYDR